MPIFHIRPDHERPAGWQILSLAEVPFYVQPSFLIFIGIIMLVQIQRGPVMPGAQWAAVSEAGLFSFIIFFSLLVHEAGHALVARLFGYRNISVSLVAFGGVTQHPPASRGHSLAITLAGPLMSIALSAAGWGLLVLNAPWMQTDVSQFIAGTFFTLNMFWAIFNLLPIFPMDGGKTVLCLLAFVMRDARALICTAILSLAMCAGLAWFFLLGRSHGANGGFLILFYLLFTFITQNVQILRDTWHLR